MADKSWRVVRLGEVLKQVWRDVPVDPVKEYSLLGAHWYAKGLYVKETKQGTKIKAQKLYCVERGDFVYNRLFAWKGSFAVATNENAGCFVSNEFPCFKLNSDRIDAQYLWYYFSRQSAWNQALGLSYGATPTSRNRLREQNFLSLEIHLPPVSEQRRIVAIIERLAAKVEKVQGIRRQNDTSTLKIIFGVLAKIVWRLEKKFGTIGLDQLIARAGYGTSKKCFPDRTNGSTPILRIPNVISENISDSDLKYAYLSEKELEKVRLEIGDLLIVRTNGSADLVGRCAVVKELNEPTGFASYLIRIHPETNMIAPDYLQRCLWYMRVSGQLFDLARTTAGQYNVSLGRIRTSRIPLPPLEEQKSIVRYLNGLQTKVNALISLQVKTAAELDAMLPSILDRAFKGEL